MYLEYHRGVFTTQAQHKRNMRESEEWTLNAEKYASLAWLNGNAYPNDEFTDAWKKIAFNGFTIWRRDRASALSTKKRRQSSITCVLRPVRFHRTRSTRSLQM